MEWDPDVSRNLHEAFKAGNVEAFRRLLVMHPEYLRNQDGTDYWMWRAAMNGDLSLIKSLVDLGMQVNESHDGPTDPNSPYYAPEGPILYAASKGHYDVVVWLLERGAQINFVVHNQRRCLPLLWASRNGHLGVVRTLISHGADLQALENNKNAITEAEDYAQFEVRDYLRSLGARTLRETTPPDYPSSHKRFIKELTQKRGSVGKWSLEIPGQPHVTLHLIPANKKYKEQTLFTVGLSDHRLPQGPQDYACTELRCMLPKDWPFTEAALRDPEWNWPVEWLKRLVCELRAAIRWPDEPAIFMNGDPPAPVAPGTKLCGWLCLKALGESTHAPDYRWIDIHSLFPIYAEEAALVRRLGHEELVKRFQAQGVPEYIDPKRPNVG